MSSLAKLGGVIAILTLVLMGLAKADGLDMDGAVFVQALSEGALKPEVKQHLSGLEVDFWSHVDPRNRNSEEQLDEYFRRKEEEFSRSDVRGIDAKANFLSTLSFRALNKLAGKGSDNELTPSLAYGVLRRSLIAAFIPDGASAEDRGWVYLGTHGEDGKPLVETMDKFWPHAYAATVINGVIVNRPVPGSYAFDAHPSTEMQFPPGNLRNWYKVWIEDTSSLKYDAQTKLGGKNSPVNLFDEAAEVQKTSQFVAIARPGCQRQMLRAGFWIGFLVNAVLSSPTKDKVPAEAVRNELAKQSTSVATPPQIGGLVSSAVTPPNQIVAYKGEELVLHKRIGGAARIGLVIYGALAFACLVLSNLSACGLLHSGPMERFRSFIAHGEEGEP